MRTKSLLVLGSLLMTAALDVGCTADDDGGVVDATATTSAALAAAIPGRWRLVYRSDMASLDGWGVSDNPTRDDSQGPRLASNVEQVNHSNWAEPNFVRLHSRPSTDERMTPDTRWASSGMGLYGQARRYGRFDVRMRSSASRGTRNVALLWPATGSWPCSGEIDFFEVSAREPARNKYNYSNHYCHADGSNGQDMVIGITPPNGDVDFTSWHTFSLVWRATEEILYIDGVQKGRVTQHIPDSPMWLGLQTAQGALQPAETRTPGHLDIADVAIYAEE